MAVTASISLVENSYSVAKNTSSVTCKVTVRWTYSSNDRNSTTKTLTLNGTNYTTTKNINSSVTTSGSMTLFNKTITVAHNSDGSKSISASVKIPTKTSSGTVTASKSLTLTKIPRYATCSQSVYAKNETQITMKWASDSTIDYVWYSINGGSSWVAVGNPASTSGSYSITGLSVGATYSIKTRVRRKDSQLTTDSTALSVATYAYPYANSMPNFTLGNNFTIGIYNPLGRTYRISFIGADNTEYPISTDYTQTSLTFSSSGLNDYFYQTIPNAQSGTYKVKITYGSSIQTRTGGTYTVNANDCSPVIAGASYRDNNAGTVAITENDQNIVQNRSLVEYTATGLSALKYASVSSCSVTVNGSTYPLTINGTTATGGNAVINSGENVQATLTITDSRGLTASRSVTVNMLALANPSAIITAQRANNFYSETNVNCDAQYSSVDGKNTIDITYKARVQGTETYTVTGSLQDNVTSIVTLDNTHSWELSITITDRFGMTTSYTAIISRGMPIIFFDRIKESVGINCFPQHSQSLEIDGDLYINSNLLQDYPIEEGTDGIWTYRKWASGLSECWGNASGTTSFTRTWGGLYICDAFTVSFPSGLFIDNPVATMSAQGGNSLIVFNGGSLTATSMKIQAGRGASASDYNYFIGIHVKGRWKQ